MDKLLKKKERRHIGAEIDALLADKIILQSLIDGVSKSKIISDALAFYIGGSKVAVMEKDLVDQILRRAKQGRLLDLTSFPKDIEENIRKSGMSDTICNSMVKTIKGKLSGKKK